jgi:hypothetical protein
MQEYLLESPWIIGLLGFFLAAVLIYAWMQSGRDLFWKSSLGVALATLALLVINVTYKTDREVLDEFIHKIAADLQANRYQEVVKSIHPDASEELRSLKSQLEAVEFESVQIKKIHGIELGKSTNPKNASIRMNVFVRASRGQNTGSVPRWVRVHLEQDRGKWFVVDYEHRDPQYEMLNRDGRERLDSLYRR